MDVNQLRPDQVTDRRVRRSRSALMSAAHALVAERGTTNVSVSEIAQAADVSRQLVYQQFGDRDTLLLETALDLARREFLTRATEPPHSASRRARVLVVTRHFAEHRSFYRAMLTGPCAFGLIKALSELLSEVNEQVAHFISRVPLDPELVSDLATFVSGGWTAVFSIWLVEEPDPLDPEAFADRLLRMIPAIADFSGVTAATAEAKEGGR